jgi:hypothetical protein
MNVFCPLSLHCVRTCTLVSSVRPQQSHSPDRHSLKMVTPAEFVQTTGIVSRVERTVTLAACCPGASWSLSTSFKGKFLLWNSSRFQATRLTALNSFDNFQFSLEPFFPVQSHLLENSWTRSHHAEPQQKQPTGLFTKLQHL